MDGGNATMGRDGFWDGGGCHSCYIRGGRDREFENSPSAVIFGGEVEGFGIAAEGERLRV